jgi:hypothetical protein
MPEDLHDEIAARFAKSGSVNFEAAGHFLAEIGPDLLVRDNGVHGIAFGKFSMLACFLRADDFGRVFRDFGGMATLSEAVDVPTAD